MSDIVERLRDADTTRRIGESYADVHDRRQRDRDEAAAEITRLRAEVERLVNGQHDVYAAAREEYRKKITEQAAENAKLRAALEEITEMPVYGFAITDTTDPHGGDVFCEGTNRFVRERDFKAVRKIARAALEEKS